MTALRFPSSASTAVLLLGMVQRQTYGIGRIGFESALLLVLYGGGVVLMVSA